MTNLEVDLFIRLDCSQLRSGKAAAFNVFLSNEVYAVFRLPTLCMQLAELVR